MIRGVDLISYLPPFLAEFKETNATLEAENPEFRIAWEAVDRVLKNEFIETADEYGISRFEKILKIFPSKDDTLDERRAKVQSRWFINFPYTWRKLLEKLTAMCGSEGFTAFLKEYLVRVQVINQDIQFARNIYDIVLLMLPANMALLFYAEYCGEYDVTIGNTASVEFVASFYPRFNLPALRLDGSWFLNGSRVLNGYDSLELVDLLPVCTKFEVSVNTEPETAHNIQMLVCAEEKAKASTEVTIRNSIKEKSISTEQIEVSASAEYDILSGEIRVQNRNILDGSWCLDGNRKLNGGLYTI